MAHIHTKPGQHDITISAYIIRTDESEPKVLVHIHKKFGKLMQIGGHIELNETPWQALAHELVEESGYDISELKVLQPSENISPVAHAVIHPVPLVMNTHMVTADHFHSDLAYGFTVDHIPRALPGEDESGDLRWLTLDELKRDVDQELALPDVWNIYTTIITSYLPSYAQIDAQKFALTKPDTLATA